MPGLIQISSGDPEVISQVGSILTGLGRRFVSSGPGKETLRACRHHDPDIILVHLHDGQRESGNFIKEVHRHCPGCRVISLVPPERIELGLMSLKIDTVDFLTLPVSSEAMGLAIQRAMDVKAMRLKVEQAKETYRLRHQREYFDEIELLEREKVARLVRLERISAAEQVVEGLSAAIRDIIEDIEGGPGLFTDVPCFASIHNREMVVVATNMLFRERLGNKIGANSWDVYAARTLSRTDCPVGQTFASGRSQRRRETVYDAGGREFPAVVRTMPLRNSRGQISLVLEIIADVTEVGGLAEKLRTTQQRYQQLFDEAPCFISVQDRDFRLTDVNRRFKENFGDKIGAHCYEIYKHRDHPCDECPVEKTFSTGEPQTSEEILTSKDGRKYNVVTWTSPIRDHDGRINQVMEMATDVTEQTRLREQLRAAQRKYQTIFDEVPCYISVQDRNFRLTALNRRFKEDFGGQIGDFCHQVYKHRSSPCDDCPVAATFEDGQSHSSEEVVTSKTGEQHNVLTLTAPIRNGDGEITEVLEISTNITQIRQMQDHLTNLGLLIGSMSHGIKGLLTGLDGGMYRLNSGLSRSNPEAVKEGFEVVKLMVGRIKATVLGILYYAKERHLNWEKVDVLRFAQDVSRSVENKITSLGIAFSRDFDPQAGEFEIDPSVAASALVNLLENAADACVEDRTKKQHEIAFKVKVSAERVIFEISDNGVGMDQSTRENLFTLFFSSKGSSGTGLGLFVSNKIIEQHGGRIEVSSSPGEGSLFRITLPRSLPSDIKNKNSLHAPEAEA